ncbi:MAG: ferritin [Armatimonadota bacterium]
MISDKMQKAINKQINAEMYSAYLYLSMSAYYTSLNLPGCANWMRVQAQEEMVHAMKFYDFVNERGGEVHLQTIDGPPTSWSGPVEPFEEAYKHELKVTSLINNLVDMATQEKDYASVAYLQWFVNEQVEEEASADAVVKQLKLVGDGQGMFLVDRELATRVFVPPVPAGKGQA